jgi:outer membrane protein OmpA-like peptidoglycan-associated protein
MKKILFLVISVSMLAASCATMNKQQKGTAAGAAGGALIGAAVSGGSIWGVLIGAAVGGTAGNLIGKKMDKQAKELKQAIPTAEVERVGSGLMFKINSAEISDSYKDDLAAAAGVFKNNPETNILVEGHTDDTGSDEVNMNLSQKRAEAVSAFLQSNGVAATRLQTKWYGESQPKYANDGEENRQKNRRVELAVYANDQMKTKAKDGKLE